MSKTALVLIVLCGLAGLALVYFFDFNPVSSMTSFIQDPMASLQGLSETLASPWTSVATGIGGVLSSMVLFANTYVKSKKQAQQIQTTLQGDLSTMSEAKAKVEGQVDGYKETINQQSVLISTKETEIAKLKQANLDKDGQIQRLQNDLNYGTKAEKDWVKQYVEKKTRKP